MSVRFLIPNPEDTNFPFSEDWEIAQWIEETGAAITVTRDTTGDDPRASVIKVVSDTDAKGIYYTAEDILESTAHIFSLAYKVDAGQEIDYLVYDNIGAATIISRTLVESSGEWTYHYEEFDTPANCTEIIIYLRAGTAAGTAFYVDDLKMQGNVLEEDPDDFQPSYPKAGSTKRTLDGTLRNDMFLTTVDFSMAFPRLSSVGFTSLFNLHKSRKETYFNDQAVPSMIEQDTIYLETQYDYVDVTKASGPHYAYEDKSASEPALRTDFETNEIETVDYQVLDDDDNNSYQDGAATTGHYVYHKFVFDISSEYTAAADVQSFEVTYKTASNDASVFNEDGVTLYAWNALAGNWVKLGATRVSTKEAISLSLMKPEQARMFVDTTNGEINLLAQSNGVKAAAATLTIDSYYIEVTVNKSKSYTIDLLNRAVLSSGRVIHVKNLTDRLTLALGPDYRMGDDAESVAVDGVFATLDGAATYFSGGDVLDVTTEDFFISLWMRRDGNPGAVEKLMEKYGGGIGWSVYIDTNGSLGAYIQDASGQTVTVGGSSICDNLWHHVLITFDRNANATRYVDGVLYDSPDAISARQLTITNVGNFTVGTNSVAPSQFWEGSICHVRFQLGGTLPIAAQILWEYNHGRDYSSQSWTLDGTRSYWKFDDAAAAANADADGMITDGSGSGNHLDAVGGVTTNYGTHSRILSADPDEVVEVKYDQYYRVMTTGLSERRQRTGTPTTPPRSASLTLQGLIGLE